MDIAPGDTAAFAPWKARWSCPNKGRFAAAENLPGNPALHLTEAIDSPLEDFIAAGAQEILVHEVELEAAKELLAAQQG